MSEPTLAQAPLAYPPGRFYDEVYEPGAIPRLHAKPLVSELGRMGAEALAAAGRRRDAIFVEQGITFDATGEDGPVRDRPFPLYPVPRILPAGEWTHIKRGLAQRIRALNRFVDDVYHERDIVREGVVP